MSEEAVAETVAEAPIETTETETTETIEEVVEEKE